MGGRTCQCCYPGGQQGGQDSNKEHAARAEEAGGAQERGDGGNKAEGRGNPRGEQSDAGCATGRLLRNQCEHPPAGPRAASGAEGGMPN